MSTFTPLHTFMSTCTCFLLCLVGAFLLSGVPRARRPSPSLSLRSLLPGAAHSGRFWSQQQPPLLPRLSILRGCSWLSPHRALSRACLTWLLHALPPTALPIVLIPCVLGCISPPACILGVCTTSTAHSPSPPFRLSLFTAGTLKNHGAIAAHAWRRRWRLPLRQDRRVFTTRWVCRSPSRL